MHGCALHRLGMLILGQDVRGHAGCKLFKMRARVVVEASQRVSIYRTTMDPDPLIPNR
jgi:hypothetical protein